MALSNKVCGDNIAKCKTRRLITMQLVHLGRRVSRPCLSFFIVAWYEWFESLPAIVSLGRYFFPTQHSILTFYIRKCLIESNNNRRFGILTSIFGNWFGDSSYATRSHLISSVISTSQTMYRVRLHNFLLSKLNATHCVN